MQLSNTTRWLLLGALLAAPYAVLFVAGTSWLYARGWLWGWLAANAVITTLGWLLIKRWRLQFAAAPPILANVEPDARWAPAGEAAWRDVEAIAERLKSQDVPLDDLNQHWQIIREVLDTVAKHFRPQSRQPALDIPVPYVLRVVELVSADLRVAFSENVPGAHILTLHDFQRMQQVATIGRRLYLLYRVVRLGVDPISAAISEFREVAGGKLANASTAEVKRWATSFFVRKAGFYAIQLYSGQLILSDVEFGDGQTRRSRDDAAQHTRRDETLANEPLRILVLGQVKAGKSSLINAMFGETRAAVDVVPRTKHVEPYLLERDGARLAIILDTVGFSEGGATENPFDASRAEVLKSDLVIVVCTAQSAARAADRQLLDGLRDFFQREPTRLIPPILVALTHIDALRPWQEWSPPYDLRTAQDAFADGKSPHETKRQNIVTAVETVAADLQVPVDHVIPVCTQTDRLYNVNDALAPAILQVLGAAERTKYQRCLHQLHDEEYWHKLWQQTLNSGRLLWRQLPKLLLEEGPKNKP